eukprot:TRINITY_DN102885_c0_g1_i1.p1 TRINITY_DN102885_c0_g1~~TRINITY_DN102885_c0_g1_i1.p1  ORF type:complete len:670 (-),score=154.37 TRINITY_DN102885_c0_g1_i1:103-2055(-)
MAKKKAAGEKKFEKRKGCSFGPHSAAGANANGSLISFAGSRWKFWGAEEAAVQISHNDTAEQYSAVCWGRAAEDGESSKNYVALGCVSGRVQVWNPLSGELLGPVAAGFSAVAKGVDCAVTAMASSQPQRGSIFLGCEGVAELLEIGVVDGATRASYKLGKGGLAQLAASCFGPEWLISAGAGTSSSLRVWALSEMSTSGKDLARAHAKLASPASSASCVDICSEGGKALALCCDGGMQVDVYACDGIGGTVPETPIDSCFALSCHEPVLSAAFTVRYDRELAPATSGKSRAAVVGFGPSLVVFWSWKLGTLTGTAKTVAPLFTVAATEIGGRVLFARTAESTSKARAALDIAYGNLAQPTFAVAREPAQRGERVALEFFTEDSKKAGTPATPEARAEKVKKAKEAKAKAKAAAEPTVIGSMEAAAVKKKAVQKRGVIAGDDEMPSKRPKLMLPETPGATPTGLSLAPVVKQGLRAKDGQSLEKILYQSDNRVIDSTVIELSGVEAFDLLQEITKRLVKAPINGITLCAWVQAVLTRHCAFIASQPTLRRALGPLSDALQSRSSMHRSLVRLRGRLQMLKHLGKQIIDRDSQEKEKITYRTPLLEYVEGDEDDVDDDSEDGGAQDGDAAEGSESGIDINDILAEDDSDDF